MREQAGAWGIELIRVAATDGKTVPPDARSELDLGTFLRRHGKYPMEGEYGCYVSHLRALDAIAHEDCDAGVVFEDDVVLHTDLAPVLEALGTRDDWDVVRFAHHRGVRHVALRALPLGRCLLRPLFGPSGSAAGYIVRRRVAAALRAELTPMRLPFDVALERGWAMGLRVRDIRPDLVGFSAHSKTSLTREGRRYDSMKLAPWRRLPTLAFRTGELVRRLIDRGGRR